MGLQSGFLALLISSFLHEKDTSSAVHVPFTYLVIELSLPTWRQSAHIRMLSRDGLQLQLSPLKSPTVSFVIHSGLFLRTYLLYVYHLSLPSSSWRTPEPIKTQGKRKQEACKNWTQGNLYDCGPSQMKANYQVRIFQTTKSEFFNMQDINPPNSATNTS